MFLPRVLQNLQMLACLLQYQKLQPHPKDPLPLRAQTILYLSLSFLPLPLPLNHPFLGLGTIEVWKFQRLPHPQSWRLFTQSITSGPGGDPPG
jgi:hypothetical protein